MSVDAKKFARDRGEAVRILKFHQAIVEEARHSALDERLVERSVQFTRRLIAEILALGVPEAGQGTEVVQQMLLILMRLHRESLEADGSAV